MDSEYSTEADLFKEDDDISVGSNLLVSDDSLSEEALQPPCPSSVVGLPVSTTLTSAELPQSPQSSVADSPNLTLNQDFPNPKLDRDYSNQARKWDLPDPLLAPNVLKDQARTDLIVVQLFPSMYL